VLSAADVCLAAGAATKAGRRGKCDRRAHISTVRISPPICAPCACGFSSAGDSGVLRGAHYRSVCIHGAAAARLRLHLAAAAA
jgi:hypothetical protein